MSGHGRSEAVVTEYVSYMMLWIGGKLGKNDGVMTSDFTYRCVRWGTRRRHSSQKLNPSW